MSWILYILFLALIGLIIYRHRFFHLPGLKRTAALWFFALKIVAGTGVWYVYTIYYPQREFADIWKYYDDGEIMFDAIHDHPGDYLKMISGIGIDEEIHARYLQKMNHWDQPFESNLFNDSHTIIRFNALARLISLGNYHTHSLFMSLLAFIGLCALYRWIYPLLFQWKKIIAFILFISPSLLFWSSGVLKEGILFFAVGMLIYHAWKFAEDKKKYRVTWCTVSILLLAMAKLYMLVFLAPTLAFGIYLRRQPRFAFLKLTGLVALLIGIAVLIHQTKPQLSPFRLIAMKQHNFISLAKGGTYVMNNAYVVYLRPDQRDKLIPVDTNSHYLISRNTEIMYWSIADDFKDTLYRSAEADTTVYTILSDSPVAGSLMRVTTLQGTPASVLKETPAAILRSICRPWPWEIKPAIVIPPLLENLFMYLLLAAMLFFYRKPGNKAVFWFCVGYALITLAITGLTTPVLGALVRYRITAIPFLLFAILMCTDKVKLIRRIPVLDRIL